MQYSLSSEVWSVNGYKTKSIKYYLECNIGTCLKSLNTLSLSDSVAYDAFLQISIPGSLKFLKRISHSTGYCYGVVLYVASHALRPFSDLLCVAI
jgi:hypothetical protein